MKNIQQDNYSSEAVSIRKVLHDIPEPSMHEEKTKKFLMDYLKNETDLVVRDCGEWFYAVWEHSNSSNSIAFRTEFDAVTNEDGTCRHLCGHDGHAAVLAAFGKWISDNRPCQRIFLIFQPGEESGEGALLCRQLLKIENIDEIYGIHNIPGYPEGTAIIKNDTFACESLGIEIKFKGIPSHAAHPEKGINPSEAIGRLLMSVSDYVKKEYRGMVQATLIGLECGSRSYGVSASEGVVRYTVRAEYSDDFVALVSFITGFAKSMSEEYGLEYDVDQYERFPVTENSPQCVYRLMKAAVSAGIDIEEPDSPFRWSEDFGWYTKLVPGAFFGIGAGESCPPLHNISYEFPDSIIPVMLKMFEEICSSYL